MKYYPNYALKSLLTCDGGLKLTFQKVLEEYFWQKKRFNFYQNIKGKRRYLLQNMKAAKAVPCRHKKRLRNRDWQRSKGHNN